MGRFGKTMVIWRWGMISNLALIIAIAGSHVLTVVFFYIKCRRSCENLSAWLAEIPSSTCTHQTLSHFNHLPKDKPSLFGNKKWIHWMWAETSNNIQQYPTITCQYAPHCTLLASSTINPCGGHCRHGIGIEATTHWCRSNHCCPQRSVARLGGRGTGTIINGCSSQPRQFFWRVSQHYPEYEADQSSRLSIYIYIVEYRCWLVNPFQNILLLNVAYSSASPKLMPDCRVVPAMATLTCHFYLLIHWNTS